MPSCSRVLLAILPHLVVARAAADAPAVPTKRTCIEASEAAQTLRKAGQLHAATEALLTCGDPACPVLVRQDCGQWMNEVRAAMPTVVLGARDAAGRDEVRVRVLVDGVKVTDVLDGKPIDVDPGEHTFVFERDGERTALEHVLVRQGERDRVITATFAGHRSPAPEPARDHTREAPPPGRGVPAATWIFGAIAAAAFGGALASDLSAFGEAGCKPSCSDGQVSSIKTKTYLAGGLAGLGVMSLSAAVFFLLTGDARARF